YTRNRELPLTAVRPTFQIVLLVAHLIIINKEGQTMESPAGPDFGSGVPISQIPDGAMTQGKVSGEDVIIARRGDEFFAVGAHCTHYGGPLAKGLMLGDELRCPLHHACFSLRTGDVLRTPAFDPIPCWRVEQIGDNVFVREKLSVPIRRP